MTSRKLQVALPADDWDELLDALAAFEANEAWRLNGAPEAEDDRPFRRLSQLLDEVDRQIGAKTKRRAS